ncbi:HPr(Ser) kinase/phosphatase [Kiritimatiella glycovorans]|uniref:HPr kinase/phosphorylase n=1 Tax=Kiritimatiella glycovorans TaxID=1307763 RepID=A0A0G3EF49_9BACT|nr:HPr(Ser) kinase/phosphatase [Kiritimatiella glycovorans]AKJ64057.1 HPr kinase/phosphorylase [Kiritimatiella glycovorans]
MNLKVKELWEEAREPFSLELEAGGEGFDNEILERAINRPGLALTGFFQYFAFRRLQVFGLAEFTYMKSLGGPERNRRLRQFCQRRVPAIVLARNRHAPDELRALADEFRIPVMRTPMITSLFINECTVLIEDLTAPRRRVQGTMLDMMGIGVMIRGAAGIGKSETALTLIERGYSLVSDDVTELRRLASGRLVGSASELTRYHMEIRGLGIIHVPSLYGVSSIRGECPLDLVIDLVKPGSEKAGRGEENGPDEIELLEARVPRVELPVMPGRDMANIVEATALNQKLKFMGHDAAKELDEKLVTALQRRSVR